jgi:hypothetical protein
MAQRNENLSDPIERAALSIQQSFDGTLVDIDILLSHKVRYSLSH